MSFNFFKFFVIGSSYAWLIIFVLLPFLVILGISLSYEDFGRMPFNFFISFSDNILKIDPQFDIFKEIFTDSLYFSSLVTSLRIAIISTFFAIIIGYPIAYGIFTMPEKYKTILLIMVMIPFWTSMLIRIYAWIVLLKNNGVINNILLKLGLISTHIEFLNTEFAVIVGVVYTYLPFMILPIYSSLEKINISLLEAAEDLGSRPTRIFLDITLPLSISGIVTGSFLVMIPALGEYVIPDLLGGIKIITLGKIIWSEFFLNRNWIAASAISIILTILIVLPFSIINKIRTKKII